MRSAWRISGASIISPSTLATPPSPTAARTRRAQATWASPAREGSADHRRLARVDARLERETRGRGVLGLRRETVQIADVDIDRVDGVLAVGGGGQQHRRPGVQGDLPVAAVAVPAGAAVHRGDQVLRPPHERGHAGRGGQGGGVEYPERRLAQGDDLPAGERAELAWRPPPWAA